MRLHVSVVNKLLELVQNYSGHEHELKLKTKLMDLDLTPYERQTTNQEVILVLTEDYVKQLSGNPGR